MEFRLKYMGSKASLLEGRLGEIILEGAAQSQRFVDLFAGSGTVSHFVANKVSTPVLSVDLQEYARIFSGSVIERTSDLSELPEIESWVRASSNEVKPGQDDGPLTEVAVRQERSRSSRVSEGFITRHYGGHYFSLNQARILDRLHAALPSAGISRTVALAALLKTASACAAAPGHTAQPFQPTKSLLPFIGKAWARDVNTSVRESINRLSGTYAMVEGKAVVGDALDFARSLHEGDLVFCDPPYSAVQYSRFYHVLEGIARGGWDEVAGAGRAPSIMARRSSEFSMKSKSRLAMIRLLNELSERSCVAIITFPATPSSNGLSASDIVQMAEPGWNIECTLLESVHSTLGGSGVNSKRGGRKKLEEAVLVLRPKRRGGFS